MKRTRYIYKNIAAVATSLLLLLSLFPSCSEDDGGGVEVDETKLYTLTIALNTSTSYTPTTRADAPEWEDEADVYERKIDKCWVVLFDATTNACVASVNSDDFIQNGTEIDNAQEVIEETVELPEGYYTGYAFANLENLTEGQSIISLLEGNDLANITKAKLNTTVSLIDANNFQLKDGKAIPMSSYETPITVKAHTENIARIVLFRMMGKVEITVTDQTGNNETKTLKSLAMGNFRNGPIHLLPYSEGSIDLNNITVADQDLLQPKFDLVPKNVQISPYTHEVPISEEGDNITVEGQTYTFYAFETGTESNTDATLSISVGINDRPVSEKPTEFSFMRRNDWLKIPVAITNIESVMRFKNMRMPIGGLPKEIIYGEGDGIQILVDAVNEVDPDYAGPVKIEIEVQSINTRITNPTILYKNTTATGSERSTAILVDNTDGLLIDAETGEPRDEKYDFTVYPSPDAPNATNKAYFEVWTQELANESDATIQLTLIAEYGDTEPKSRIEIPYTIRIQNYKRTTDGGN